MKVPPNLFLLIPFLLNLVSFTALANLLEADPSLAVSFFKSPQSLFPSGQANKQELMKSQQQIQNQIRFLVKKDGKEHWVNSDELILDIQTSRWVMTPKSKEPFEILRILDDRAELRGQNETVWHPIQELVPTIEDLGLALPLTYTGLKKDPEWKSETVGFVYALSRLKLVNIVNSKGSSGTSWALVESTDGTDLRGYVDLNSCILKADFASMVWLNQTRGWQEVSHREGAELILKNESRIKLGDIKALLTKADLGVLSRATESGLMARQNVLISRVNFSEWFQSTLPGHGKVYWQNQTKNLEMTPMTNEEILKREIFSSSFHPEKKDLGLTSAQGVFLTQDGKTWKQLPLFGKQNHPVLITKEGHLYVGPYRSLDGGVSFAPYLRWDYLTKYLQQNQKGQFPLLKLVKLESLPHKRIQLQFDTGSRKIELVSRLDQSVFHQFEAR